jgi:protein arginine N-methyltransferase 5
MMKKSGASCGLSFSCPAEIQSALQVATVAGYDFLVLPIVHPRFRHSFELQSTRPYSFTRSDLLLTSSEWTSLVVGVISRHLSLDSSVMSVRRDAEEALQKELNFAAHLGLPAVVVNLNGPNNANLSRMIYSYLLKNSNCQVSVRVPMNPPKVLGLDEPWHWWDTFRGNANTEKRLNLALSLDEAMADEQRLKRWLGEPVKCLILQTRFFLVNKKGYPVLPRALQNMVRQFYPLRVQFIIEGKGGFYEPLSNATFNCYT